MSKKSVGIRSTVRSVRPSMGSHPPGRQDALPRAGEYVVGKFSA